MQTNSFELTGKVKSKIAVTTKTGKPMAMIFLSVGRESFKIVMFGNLAERAVQLSEGDKLGVRGEGSVSKWKKDDVWQEKFQVSAWELEIDDEVIVYEKSGKKKERDIPMVPDDAIF